MKQACEKTGFTYDTLKFYCNEGLIPNVKRDKNNYRIFNDKDIEWIKSLSCLKSCDMSIIEMKEYLDLCLLGEKTIPERKKILDNKLKELEHKINKIQDSINFIHWKQGGTIFPAGTPGGRRGAGVASEEWNGRLFRL